MTWAPITEQPFTSQHLGERHLAELRVSPEAQPIYAALVPDSSFAQGSLVVETLVDPKTNARGPILALERTESDWRYWVLDARGVPEPNHSAAACAGCHAAAPAAPLFGAPRPAPPAPAATAGFPVPTTPAPSASPPPPAR
jgi:hypothetical protein